MQSQIIDFFMDFRPKTAHFSNRSFVNPLKSKSFVCIKCDSLIDAVLEAGDFIYVIEFKLDRSADCALKQIQDKEYFKQYTVWKEKKRIHLVGVSFSSKMRNISEWKEVVL